MSIATTPQPIISYPESDGQPIADNTRQFRWIVTLQGGFDRLFAEHERANAEHERAERLAAQLRALGIDPEGI